MNQVKKTIFLSLVIYSGLIASGNPLVPEGFFSNPLETQFGIVASDEFESSLYLISESGKELLVSAPGCARYISISYDRTRIGFKFIDPLSGRQAPAIYDLSTGSITKLHEDVDEAGQVSFSRDGKSAFTIGKQLYIVEKNRTVIYDLGIYVNRATISPDGSYVIYKDENDQLVVFDTNNKIKQVITDNKNGYYNASWSSDGNYAAFQSIDAKVFIYDISKSSMKLISKGENPRWSDELNEIVFVKKEIDFQNLELTGSEIYNYDAEKDKLIQVTNSADIHEMDPSFSSGSENIYYHTYDKREIVRHNLENDTRKTIVKSDAPLHIKHYQSLNKVHSSNNTTDAPDWIHIHQVFDTRDSGSWTNDPVNGRHQGYLACGATAAMEVVATYGILPPDPMSTYEHTSYYGKYISDSYTINDYTFTGFNINPNGNPGFHTGAHGFMWNYGSPHSNTVSFLTRHGIDASLSDYITWAKVKSELDKNFPYILCSTSLTSGHIVTAVGQYGTGHTLYCNDPYGNKNEGSYGGIRNGKNAVYDWADANTGHVRITPVVWGVTARYSRSLNLLATYPEDDGKDISTTVTPMLQFYGQVEPTSLESRIEILDQSGNPIPFELNTKNCDEGVVYIMPSVMLNPDEDYSIIVRNGIESAAGLSFNRNVMVKFKTGYDLIVDEAPRDNFESSGNRTLLTSGVNESGTSLVLESEVKVGGAFSAKLEYKFTSSGYCRVLYSPEIELNDLENMSVGIWVNGDCSGNNFEIWFSDGNNNLEKGMEKIIDWSGWKFINFEALNLTDKNKKYFNSFAVRKESGALTSGIVHFDDLTIYETFPSAASHTPARYDEDVPVESPVRIEFNRAMNTVSVEEAFSILPEISGTFNWTDENRTMTFNPSEPLTGHTNYEITIGPSASDVNGKSINGEYTFSFVTERTSLTLVRHYPLENETNVSIMPKIMFHFDAPVDPSTLAGNILFKDEQNNDVEIVVDFTVYSKGQVVFNPAYNLDEDKAYKLILKPAIGGTDGMIFGLNQEFIFTTETNRYLSGNIIHDFESSSDWINPLDADGSLGLDFINNTFSLSSQYHQSGSNAGMLEYSFNGIEGVSRLQNSEGISAGSAEQFGMWVYGDFSGNVLEYWFTDAWENMHTLEAAQLNWTGWKLITVDVSQYNYPKLNSIAVKQTAAGNTRGTIYIDDIQTDIILPVEGELETLPTKFSLSQNYPNPFNPSTVIEYSLPAGEAVSPANNRQHQVSVSLKVYDVLGREVAVLVNEHQKPGTYRVEFSARGGGNAGNIASGIYFYSLSAGSFNSTKKMILLR